MAGVKENFAEVLAVGGKSNSLGRAGEVVDAVLGDRSRLEELYLCAFHDNPWIRMRAIDAVEKVCRQHPDWLVPFIDRMQDELASCEQASVRWHLAQILAQVDLTSRQKSNAITWLQRQLDDTDVDWIVAVNSMKALTHFVKDGSVPSASVTTVLERQRGHKSKSVVRNAEKLLADLASAGPP